MNDKEIREMAARYLDSEIARLTAMRTELARHRPRMTKMTTERAAEVRKQILAGASDGKKSHWTQRAENKSKLQRVVTNAAKARKAVVDKTSNTAIARRVWKTTSGAMTTNEALSLARADGWRTKGDEAKVWSQLMAKLHKEGTIKKASEKGKWEAA